MLRRISGSLQCPKCDANVNMEEIDEDMVYTCGYCGATGLIKIDYLE
jgi:DNA-directed RNA polymerase subunit RPC12/RpoP